jgi:16S rRNA processing protein RimM
MMTSTPSPHSADPSSTDDWLPVGQLVGAQGLRGELRLNPASDFPERFTEPGPRWLQAKGSEPKEVELLEGRQLPGKSIYVVRLKGVNNRANAEALVGCTVLVPATDRPELADGEFHLLDLVGLEARLGGNDEPIGTVSNLISGGNDLLEIKLSNGKTVLVPFVEAIVPEVQLEEGWLLLTPPPGLLEL